MPRELSYQRLLEITSKLPPDEQEYVMVFLSNNGKKTRQKIDELEKEKREYHNARLLARDRARDCQRTLEEKVAWLRRSVRDQRSLLHELNGRLGRALAEPAVLADPSARAGLAEVAGKVARVLEATATEAA